MTDAAVEGRIDGFIDKYTPAIAAPLSTVIKAEAGKQRSRRPAKA
jgi:hypothetical protein